MTYLSVCSGIEAATVAWKPLGFKPVGFAEIEPFPCELLKQKPKSKNSLTVKRAILWIFRFNSFDKLIEGEIQ
ncbi:hypothetical protein [Treponema sp. OMZ 799]|uniref:hypothetical protein n=1 Tax=Treponema sp. OMZ 799 TaxID=2563668 RepID=UPI0020A538E4|nr:hypothetical protein [Treponema sp. OMZ 799]